MKNAENVWLAPLLVAGFSVACILVVVLCERRKDGDINWAWEWASAEDDYHE